MVAKVPVQIQRKVRRFNAAVRVGVLPQPNDFLNHALIVAIAQLAQDVVLITLESSAAFFFHCAVTVRVCIGKWVTRPSNGGSAS